MTVYTVVHTCEFGKHGAACSINLHHFLSKQDAIDNMCNRFENCRAGYSERDDHFYDTDVNDYLGYAYIRHFEGDPWGSEPQTPVYDHEWRVIAEML